MSTLLLASGGLDSSLVLSLLLEARLHGGSLFVDYGQRAGAREWRACKAVHKQLGASAPVRLGVEGIGHLIPSGLTSRERDIKLDAFLPGRNTLLALLGSAYAATIGCDAIALGLLHDDTNIFFDQTSHFLSRIERLLPDAVGRPVRVVAPLKSFTKQGVVALAKKRGIVGTYSCHAGAAKRCGHCISCEEFTT